MANRTKTHINLVGSSANVSAPSRKRKMLSKSKSRRKAGTSSAKTRGSSRATR